jgi:8-oxo-dGTP pyrophosphatase MutT (NUDIX family)
MGRTLISTGSWDGVTQWELYLSDDVPALETCSAVLCVAKYGDGIVLARAKRGWGMLGGHIERGESLEEALLRELAEEAGYTPDSYRIFGHRRLISPAPVPHGQRDGEFYPYPESNIVYFIAESSQRPTGHTESDILESRIFTPEELDSLETSDHEVITMALRLPAN